MKRLNFLSSILIVTSTLLTPLARGEEAEVPPPPTRTDKPEQTAEKNSEQQDKGTVGDIFRPSEEISEDFAVSFPVDI